MLDNSCFTTRSGPFEAHSNTYMKHVEMTADGTPWTPLFVAHSVAHTNTPNRATILWEMQAKWYLGG